MAYTPESWDKIIRQVLLRANMLQADSAATLATNYAIANVGQTEMSDRAIEFPFEGVVDAILNACDRLIGLIALDKSSHYRSWFSDSITGLASGDLLKFAAPSGIGQTTPITANTNSIRIGVIGSVFDSTTNAIPYTFKPFLDVTRRNKLSGLKQPVYWYWTDNVRIYHTGTFNTTPSTVSCDCVVWDKTFHRSAIAASVASGSHICPFPEDLHEAIVCGALSYLFRGSYNMDQVNKWREYFNETLIRIGANIAKDETQSRLLYV